MGRMDGRIGQLKIVIFGIDGTEAPQTLGVDEITLISRA